MDPKSIKELEILQEVSESEHVSQRHLSKKLGMAAGLVNMYIKRLARKGYIKVTGMNHRRLKYLITPQGIKEKTRLTYEFALLSFRYYRNTTEDIREKFVQLQEGGTRSVALYGTGELAELCLLLIGEYDIEVVAVVDDESENSRFHGFPVIPRDLLPNLKFDKVIVVKIDGHDEIPSLLAEFGVDAERICWLVDVSPEVSA